MSDLRVRGLLRLARARATAQRPLLLLSSLTAAVAVATIVVSVTWLQRAAVVSSPPAGVDPAVHAEESAVGVASLAAAAPALVVVVVMVGAAALGQVARLVSIAREREDATLRARGLSGFQARNIDLAEGAVLVTVGVAVGLLLGLGVSFATGVPVDSLAAVGFALLPTAVVLAGVYVVAVGGGGRMSTARARTVGSLLGVVVIVLSSVLVIWQLPQAEPGRADPVVAIAPAVILAAAAVVALAAFGAVVVAWAAPRGRRRGLGWVLPARQVSRRLPVFAAAVVLVSLAAGSAVFAAAYGATWRAEATTAAAVGAGAPVRVDLAPQSASAELVQIAADVPGVRAAAGALIQPVEVGSSSAELIALPAAVPGVMVDGSASASLEAMSTPGAAPGLGNGASAIRVEALVTGPPAVQDEAHVRGDIDVQGWAPVQDVPLPAVRLSAIVIDAGGVPATIALRFGDPEPVAGGVRLNAEAALPPGAAPWRVLALVAGTGPGVGTREATVSVSELVAVGGETLSTPGETSVVAGGPESLLWAAAGDASSALPVGVASAFAERLGLAIGDTFALRYEGSGRRVDAVVDRILSAIPGASTDLAVFAPLESLLVSQLQRGTSVVPPNSVWLDAAPGAAGAVSAALGDRAVRTAQPGPGTAIVGALTGAWWVAVAGTVVLAVIGALAITRTLAHARHPDLGILRALGVTARQQAWMRATELTVVLLLAVALGAAAGALGAALIVPPLIQATTPGLGAVSGAIAFEGGGLAAAGAALVVGLIVVVGAAAGGVARRARHAVVGEDAR
ncbi:hypothetical protein LG315_05480 [Microbacterium marinum]|uniref:FtsX-like permease family protein n=1 Tax=Microbacterium marinum TaxID=421115 RepID=UPI00384DA9D2